MPHYIIFRNDSVLQTNPNTSPVINAYVVDAPSLDSAIKTAINVHNIPDGSWRIDKLSSDIHVVQVGTNFQRTIIVTDP